MLPSIRNLKHAWSAYRKHLDGVFCIYKPTDMTTGAAVAILKTKIINDLNRLPLFERPKDVIARNFQLSSGTAVVENKSGSLIEKWPEHQLTEKQEQVMKFKLVHGELFMMHDVYTQYLCSLHRKSSGVLMIGIGRTGVTELKMIKEAKFLRVYHVKGRFGYATHNFFTDGNFIERSTYHHITQGKLDKVCSAAQSGHQRLMFEYAGVNQNSQEAYELACQGIIRPNSTDTPPILYGIKCIYYNPPDFTLEIHAINETCEYMAELINDIGLKLKSNAVCVHIHRIRHGHFTLEDTLLHKDWNISGIVSNMKNCERHLTPDKLVANITVKKENSAENNEEMDEVSLYEEMPSALQLAQKYSKHKPLGKDGHRNQGSRKNMDIAIKDSQKRNNNKTKTARNDILLDSPENTAFETNETSAVKENVLNDSVN